MKCVFLTVAGAKVGYATEAEATFIKKIAPLVPFEVVQLKARSAGRDDRDFKREQESQLLAENIGATDEVWLFDELGKQAKDSKEFSQWFVRSYESGKKRLVFIIGGPFGTSDELKKRANRIVGLSTLTMNHHVAKIVALEQIYRALAIAKNLPYHN